MKKIAIIIILGLAIGYTIYNLNVDPVQQNRIMDPSPEGRDQWRSMMRNHNHAPGKVDDARNDVRVKMNKAKERQKDAGLNQWTSLGPDQVGGRVRAIATHPNNPDILFVGGVSGGIWKSNNGGASWMPKGDLLPSLAVTSILVHPTSPDTMFLSTGEGVKAGGPIGGLGNPTPGAGIFRSFDGGNTWEKIPAITDANMDMFYWINKIIFNPNDPSKIVAVGSDKNQDGVDQSAFGGVLHYITNHGEVLQDTDVLLNRGGFIDVDWPAGKDNLLVGTQFNLMLFQYNTIADNMFFSSDRGGLGGLPDGLTLGRVEISVSPLNINKVYALCQDISGLTFGRLFVSEDFGLTWTERDMLISGATDPIDVFKNGAGGNQGSYDNTIWVSPLDHDEIIIGGIEIWRSLDGGDSFTKISEHINYNFGTGTSPHADIHIIIAASDFSSGNKKIYVGSDGGIASTDDYQGVSQNSGWSLINNNLSITQFYASDVRPGTGVVAGAQDNGTSLYDQGANSWAELVGGDGGYCAFGRDDTIYLSSQNGTFYYTYDNGTSLTFMNVLATPKFIAPMKAWDGGDKVLMADENLWYSPNPTVSFVSFVDVSPSSAISGTTITAIEIDQNEIVWVGYSDGRIYRADFTSYPALTWAQVGDFSKLITDIAVNPNNTSKVAFSLGGYDDDNIYITQNNGSTWFSRSNGIPALHVNSLIWHKTENAWLYAGTDLGIFATEDNGQNWNVSPNFAGISDGPVFTEITNLEWGGTNAITGFSPLYVTTYGRGIWKTEGDVRDRDLYVDEDYVGLENGQVGTPFNEIKDAEDVQAHGQTWHVDGGTYPVNTNNAIIIDKRIGELKLTGVGPVIIGNN